MKHGGPRGLGPLSPDYKPQKSIWRILLEPVPTRGNQPATAESAINHLMKNCTLSGGISLVFRQLFSHSYPIRQKGNCRGQTTWILASIYWQPINTHFHCNKYEQPFSTLTKLLWLPVHQRVHLSASIWRSQDLMRYTCRHRDLQTLPPASFQRDCLQDSFHGLPAAGCA